MAKHAWSEDRVTPRRRAGVTTGLVVVTLAVVLGLVARSRATAQPDVTPTSQGVAVSALACAGGSATVTRTSASSVVVTCSDAVTAIGSSTHVSSARTSVVRTALPTGAGAGSFLVATVRTAATSTVTLTGWTRAYDVVTGARGVRLSTWWRTAAAGQGAVTGAITPAAPASMITSAFAGVDPTRPVTGAFAAPGARSAAGSGDLRVLALAAPGTTAPGAPAATTVLAKVAAVPLAVAAAGSTAGAGPWSWTAPAGSIAGTMGLRGAATVASAGVPLVSAGGSRTVTCASGSIADALVSRSQVSFSCSSASGLRLVGTSGTFASGSSGAPRAGLPSGAASGDVVIGVVTTYDFASVRFGSGWTTAYDAHPGGGVRMVAAWKVVTAADVAAASVTAQVSPATQVSMATVALRGADPKDPIEQASAASGAVSPSVTTSSGAALVLAQGSTAWQSSPTAPAGATLVASVSDHQNAAVSVAVGTSAVDGRSAPAAWGNATSATPVASGTLAVRPAVAGALPTAGPVTTPSGTPSATAGPSATGTSGSGTSGTGTSTSGTTSGPVAVAAPVGTAPASPTVVCDTASLTGPATAPAGAVSVSPGQNLPQVVAAHGGNTTFWLAPGTYTLGTGAYDQVVPQSGDSFIGAPGAIIDGQHRNLYAFAGTASGVTLAHLTVQNFGSAGQNNNEGVVNHDSATGWTVTADTIQSNAGAGLMIGSGDQITDSCLRNNGQYGFNAYNASGVSDIVLEGNEISGNNTDDWERRQPGCGCTGGGKFWATRGATVTNNYVHDNHGVGLWADTDNTGFLFQGNYISGNDDEGLMYEISYNAAILDNTFMRNAIVKGPTNPGFPASAIYISESGSDPRVSGPYGSTFRISGNSFTDNWAGIVAWENADRFEGSPANSSTGALTLVAPDVATLQACSAASTVAAQPYLADCRWKTQNLLVDHNTFSLNAANISGCTAAKGCGYNGLFSNYGSYPTWSPYKGTLVEDDVTFKQNNVWQDNTYEGPWSFMAHAAGNAVSWSVWRAAPYSQDAGSTLG